MYIGAIPTPAATESRQEFTATANQTVFSTTGGTVGYCDCFLNGVKMAASDFSFDGADVTLTSGAAAGDTLAVVMRQADNALVALPITDSAGNNVLSEANNVVSIGNIVKPATGSVVQINSLVTDTQVEYQDSDSWQEVTPLEISITPRFSNSKFLVQYTITLCSSTDGDAYQFCNIIPYFKINSGSYNIAVRASTAPPLSLQIQGGFTLTTGEDDIAHTHSFQFIHVPSYNLNDVLYYAPFFRTGYSPLSHTYLNRSWDITANTDYNGYYISTATITEISN